MEQLKRSIQSSLAIDSIQLDPGINTRTSRIQLLYGVWVNVAQLAIGLALGFSSVLIPQLSAPDSEIHVTLEDASWIASVLALFCPVGCIISGIVMDRHGRRIMLIYSQLPMFIGWLYTSFSKTPKDLILGRAITGVGCGMSMGPPRVYCTEIALPNMRGVIGSFPGLAVSLGITLLAGFGTLMHWNYICYACCLFTLINFISFTMLPETPYYVVQHKTEQEARENLAMFRGPNYDVDEEMKQLRDFKENNDLRKLSFAENMKVLFNKASCKPFILVVTYIFFSQAVGNNFIVYWATELLTIANSSFNPRAGNMLLGVTRVFSAGVTAALLYKIGKRAMAIISATGVTIVCLVLGLFLIYNDTPSLIPQISLMLYMVFATLGYYTLPLLIGFELYPLQVRGILGGATVSIFCLAMFASTKVKPLALEVLGISYLFVAFGVTSLLGIIYLYLYLPETKDLTLQEIEEYYKDIRPTLVSQRRIMSMSQMATNRTSVSKSKVTQKGVASKIANASALPKLEAQKNLAKQESPKTRVIFEDDDRDSTKSTDSKKIRVIFEESEDELLSRTSIDERIKDVKDPKSKKSKENKGDKNDDKASTSKK